MIYLDYAATTPISESALTVYSEVAKNHFGNASSLHDVGTQAKDVLEQCRQELATLINASPDGVYFTSGGTQSNILAIKALLHARKSSGNHIITSTIEHASITNYLKQLEIDYGYEVTYLPVDQNGQINVDELKEAITQQTILITIQHANSEIGVIQPVSEIAAVVHEKDILFHSDCVQTFGKIPINLEALHVDSISVSSHKIYGPKGVGAVYINPLIAQDDNFIPGTVNVPGIAAFVCAAQEAYMKQTNEFDRLLQLRNFFIQEVDKLGVNVEIFTHPKNQLPHVIGLQFSNVQDDYAMLEFNRAGVAISTGSACQVGKQEPSKTMIGIGKSREQAKRFIRLSMGIDTTEENMAKVAHLCKNIVMDYESVGKG